MPKKPTTVAAATLTLDEGTACVAAFTRVSADGRRVLTGARTEPLRIWDTTTGKLVRSFDAGREAFCDAVFTPSGARVVGRTVNSLRAWDLDTKKPAWSVKGVAWAGRLALSPDGLVVATSGQGARVPPGAVRRFSTETGEELGPLGVGARWWLSDLAFSRDGALVLCGTRDGALLALRVDDGSVAWTAAAALSDDPARPRSVQRVAASPRSSVFAALSDQQLALFDAATGARVCALSRAGATALAGSFALALSADGARLVSVLLERAPRVWDVASGRELPREGEPLPAVGPGARVVDAALSPDGAWVALAREGAPLTFWHSEREGPLRPPLPLPAAPLPPVSVPPPAARVVEPAPAERVIESRDEALVRGFLSPKSTTLSAAISAAQGVRGAREAWERLAARGVIPEAWVDNPVRRFFRGMNGPPEPFPQNVACCVPMASDVAGIERCELLAREAASRLAPWGVAPVESVLWRIDRESAAAVVKRPLDAVLRALRGLVLTAAERDEAKRPRIAGVVRSAVLVTACNEAAECESLWNAGASAKLSVAARGEPHALTSANNPFTPLLDIWALGYVPLSLNAGRAFLFAARTV